MKAFDTDILTQILRATRLKEAEKHHAEWSEKQKGDQGHH
jgi:hypothetical protein